MKTVLKGLPGVAGIGVTPAGRKGGPGLRVNVSEDAPASTIERIPALVQGLPVEIRRVGPIRMRDLRVEEEGILPAAER